MQDDFDSTYENDSIVKYIFLMRVKAIKQADMKAFAFRYHQL